MSKLKRVKKQRTTAFSTILGMSLLLFLIGIFAYIFIVSTGVSRRLKEQLQVDVFFREDVKEVDILKMSKEIASRTYVVSAQYVSKDSAKSLLLKELGKESFEVIEGVNPIHPSIAVNLSADYINPDSADSFKKSILSGNEHLIEEVYYSESQFAEISDAFGKFKYLIFILGVLLLLVAIALINNTIRLAVYAKRFTIKTMQLVGAKPGFIRRPFMIEALGQGFISGVIAVLLLLGCGYWFAGFDPGYIQRLSASEEVLNQQFFQYTILFISIVVLGVLISWFSTFIALSKYIWIKPEKLF